MIAKSDVGVGLLVLALAAVTTQGQDAALRGEHAGWEAVLSGLLSAFDSADVLMLGEAHTRKVDSDLRVRLIRHPEFPAKARFIVVEFGTAVQQPVLDRYVAGEEVPPAELDPVRGGGVRAALIDAVREVNRSLPSARRLRILLAGVANAPPRERNARAIAVLREHVLSQREKALVVFGSGHVWHREGGLTRGLEEIIPGRVFVADTLAPVSNGRSGPKYDELDASLRALEQTIASRERPALLMVRQSAAAQLPANPFYLGQAMLPPATTLGDLHDAVVFFGRDAAAGTLVRP